MIKITPKTTHAISIASRYALIFGAIFFAFLIATIVMVKGDGTAPGITHLSAAILSFTVKVLGMPHKGGLFPVVVFWSLLVFFAVFLFVWVSTKKSLPKTSTADNKKSYWTIGIVVGLIVLLVFNHLNEQSSENEKELVVEFVQNNVKLMREAGKGTEASLSMTMLRNGSPIQYEVVVFGENTLYAIVEAPSWFGSSEFTLICTTTVPSSDRDPYKHPCDQ